MADWFWGNTGYEKAQERVSQQKKEQKDQERYYKERTWSQFGDDMTRMPFVGFSWGEAVSGRTTDPRHKTTTILGMKMTGPGSWTDSRNFSRGLLDGEAMIKTERARQDTQRILKENPRNLNETHEEAVARGYTLDKHFGLEEQRRANSKIIGEGGKALAYQTEAKIEGVTDFLNVIGVGEAIKGASVAGKAHQAAKTSLQEAQALAKTASGKTAYRQAQKDLKAAETIAENVEKGGPRVLQEAAGGLAGYAEKTGPFANALQVADATVRAGTGVWNTYTPFSMVFGANAAADVAAPMIRSRLKDGTRAANAMDALGLGKNQGRQTIRRGAAAIGFQTANREFAKDTIQNSARVFDTEEESLDRQREAAETGKKRQQAHNEIRSSLGMTELAPDSQERRIQAYREGRGSYQYRSDKKNWPPWIADKVNDGRFTHEQGTAAFGSHIIDEIDKADRKQPPVMLNPERGKPNQSPFIPDMDYPAGGRGLDKPVGEGRDTQNRGPIKPWENRTRGPREPEESQKRQDWKNEMRKRANLRGYKWNDEVPMSELDPEVYTKKEAATMRERGEKPHIPAYFVPGSVPTIVPFEKYGSPGKQTFPDPAQPKETAPPKLVVPKLKPPKAIAIFTGDPVASAEPEQDFEQPTLMGAGGGYDEPNEPISGSASLSPDVEDPFAPKQTWNKGSGWHDQVWTQKPPNYVLTSSGAPGGAPTSLDGVWKKALLPGFEQPETQSDENDWTMDDTPVEPETGDQWEQRKKQEAGPPKANILDTPASYDAPGYKDYKPGRELSPGGFYDPDLEKQADAVRAAPTTPADWPTKPKISNDTGRGLATDLPDYADQSDYQRRATDPIGWALGSAQEAVGVAPQDVWTGRGAREALTGAFNALTGSHTGKATADVVTGKTPVRHWAGNQIPVLGTAANTAVDLAQAPKSTKDERAEAGIHFLGSVIPGGGALASSFELGKGMGDNDHRRMGAGALGVGMELAGGIGIGEAGAHVSPAKPPAGFVPLKGSGPRPHMARDLTPKPVHGPTINEVPSSTKPNTAYNPKATHQGINEPGLSGKTTKPSSFPTNKLDPNNPTDLNDFGRMRTTRGKNDPQSILNPGGMNDVTPSRPPNSKYNKPFDVRNVPEIPRDAPTLAGRRLQDRPSIKVPPDLRLGESIPEAAPGSAATSSPVGYGKSKKAPSLGINTPGSRPASPFRRTPEQIKSELGPDPFEGATNSKDVNANRMKAMPDITIEQAQRNLPLLEKRIERGVNKKGEPFSPDTLERMHKEVEAYRAKIGEAPTNTPAPKITEAPAPDVTADRRPARTFTRDSIDPSAPPVPIDPKRIISNMGTGKAGTGRRGGASVPEGSITKKAWDTFNKRNPHLTEAEMYEGFNKLLMEGEPGQQGGLGRELSVFKQVVPEVSDPINWRDASKQAAAEGRALANEMGLPDPSQFVIPNAPKPMGQAKIIMEQAQRIMEQARKNYQIYENPEKVFSKPGGFLSAPEGTAKPNVAQLGVNPNLEINLPTEGARYNQATYGGSFGKPRTGGPITPEPMTFTQGAPMERPIRPTTEGSQRPSFLQPLYPPMPEADTNINNLGMDIGKGRKLRNTKNSQLTINERTSKFTNKRYMTPYLENQGNTSQGVKKGRPRKNREVDGGFQINP